MIRATGHGSPTLRCDTGQIKPGESSSPVTFDKEGEFKYHCKIHGKTMSGTIVVKLAAAN